MFFENIEGLGYWWYDSSDDVAKLLQIFITWGKLNFNMQI